MRTMARDTDPQFLARLLTGVLERSRLLAVVLDQRRMVVWANGAFRDRFLAGRPPNGASFKDLLQPDSGRLLDQLGPLPPDEELILELRHPTPTGDITVRYHLAATESGLMVALGTDRTEEVELVAQMSALVEDLHREIESRTQLSNELERMAITDFLTGVMNRRQFDKVLQDEWGRLKRYGSHFALLLIDLDHFKEINDRFGHQAGDEVLKRMGRVLRATLRSEDSLARYGGEEFAVIAIGANETSARDLAERLRQRVRGGSLPAGVPPVTITVGVASTVSLPPGSDLPFLLRAADEALYRGKAAGRDRVVIYRKES